MAGIILFSVLFLIGIAVYFMQKSARDLEKPPNSESPNVKTLTDENFERNTAKGICLVDFWAPWCSPCLKQNPVISQLADELKGKVIVGKLNVDENKETTARMKIKNIPNIIIFKDGRPVKQLIGIKSKEVILRTFHSIGA